MLDFESHHRTAANLPGNRSGLRCAVRLLVLFALIFIGSGCTGLRLPAIDPTGERILLPAPNFTTFDDRSSFQGPVWTSPPQAPLAGTPAAGVAVVPYSLQTPTPPLFGPFTSPNPFAAPGSFVGVPTAAPSPQLTGSTSLNPRDGIQGRLVLSPQRLSVPIGQEVLLRAAICGGDGYLVTGQPLEWSLAQNSVGTIVEVDQQNKSLCRQILGRPPYKRSSDSALGVTSCRPQVVPRGTPSPLDDLSLVRGETWISVTSASAGEMNVHCLAPRVAGWEQRRASATIQWVGPNGAVANPATTPGVAVAPGVATIPVPTPATPVAPAPAANVPPALSSTLPPAQPAEPAAPAGRPDVAVSITGPRTAKVDEELTYRINIRNNGQADADNVEVSSKIPAGMRFVQSVPPANVFGDRLVWRVQGALRPGQSQDVTLRHIAERGGQMNVCATLDYLDAERTEECTPTTVQQDALSVDVRGPTTVRIGETLPLQIQVTNHSDRDLNNIILRDEYGSGLTHPDGPSPIEVNVGTIPAGSTRRYPIEFQVRGAGRLCHLVKVTADDGSTAQSESCVNAGAAASEAPRFDGPAFGGPNVGGGAGRAALSVVKTGPVQMGVGQEGLFKIQITNTGEVPLNGLRVIDEFDPLLVPLRATYGVARTGNAMNWSLPQLGVGQTTTIEVIHRGDGPSNRACNRVRVTSDEGASGEDNKCVSIVPAGGASWTPSPLADSIASAGPTRSRPVVQRRSAAGGGIRLDGSVEPMALSTASLPAAADHYGEPNDHPLLRGGSPFSPYRPLGNSRLNERVHQERSQLAAQLPPVAPTRLPREAFPSMTPAYDSVVRHARHTNARPTAMNGDWQVDIRRRSSSSGSQDSRTTYTVQFANHSTVIEENVVLTIEAPQGTEFYRSLNPPMIRESRRSSDGRTVEFLPISSLRGGESATFQIVVRGTEPRRGSLRAKITSDRWPEGSVFTDGQ